MQQKAAGIWFWTNTLRGKTMKKLIFLLSSLSLLTACNPTVRLETPSEPIRIEANITIKHEIRIVVEKEVEEIFDEDEGLF